MKDTFRIIQAIVAALLLVGGLAYFGFEMSSYFRPKYTELDNKVFKESQQYTDGMIRDLQNLQMEYLNGDQSKKDAIRAIVLHRFSVFPEDKLTPDLRNFYNKIKEPK